MFVQSAIRTFVLAGLAATALAAQDQVESIPSDAAGGTLQRGVPANNLPGHRDAASTNNLIDHGGKILPTSNIYYIWWGNQSAWPNDATSLTSLASGLNGSKFLTDIFPQYMRGAGVATQFKTSLYDNGSTPPGHGPKTSIIVSEACKIIAPNGLTPDPSAIYVVLTSNFPKGVNYCAWHGLGTCNGKSIQVAYMPNTTGVSGCNDPQLTCNTHTPGTNSIANVLSHEISEAITDPALNAWYDSSGSEIGDKCAWTFQACVNLTNSSWQLQREWSNKVSACVQQ